MKNIKLGVNINHNIATIHNIINMTYPDLLKSTYIAKKNSADNITIHQRKDKKNITEKDINTLKKNIKTKLNLKNSLNDEIIDITCKIKSYSCYLIPVKTNEFTTEKRLKIKKTTKNKKNNKKNRQKQHKNNSIYIFEYRTNKCVTRNKSKNYRNKYKILHK